MIFDDKLVGSWITHWPNLDIEETKVLVKERVELAKERWQLSFKEQITEGIISIIYRAETPDGQEVILKVAPEHLEMSGEVEFARLTSLAMSILDQADQGMTLLVEAANPGTALHKVTDNFQAVSRCGQLATEIAEVKPSQQIQPFRERVLDRLPKMLERSQPLLSVYDQGLLEAGREALNCLLTEPEVLCHGDLHPGNILLHQDKWRVIDAKGYRGPMVFDLQCLLIKPDRLLPGKEWYDYWQQYSDASGVSLDKIKLGLAGLTAYRLTWMINDHPSRTDYWPFIYRIMQQALA